MNKNAETIKEFYSFRTKGYTMRDSYKKRSFHKKSSKIIEECLGNKEGDNVYFSKAINSNMTEHYTIPPSRIWDNIEKILDEQDSRRKKGSSLIASSFQSKEKRIKTFVLAVAGVSFLATIIWNYNLK